MTEIQKNTMVAIQQIGMHYTKMKKWIYVLIFVVGIIPLISAVTINNGTVFNTTSSNSSLSFSFNINVNNFTIKPTHILLYGINFTNSTGTYICDDVNHSTANSNFDSSEFNCTLQISSPNEDSTTEESSGTRGSGGLWTGIKESQTLEELKLTIGVNKNSILNKEIKSNLTGIKKINIISKDRIYGDIIIKPLESIPKECNIEYEKNYSLYELVNITGNFNVSKIENLTFQWAIDNSWTQENNVSEIQIVKCFPKYEILGIEKINQTEDKIYYDVYSDSFSVWAVLGVKDFYGLPEEIPSKEISPTDERLKIENWVYIALGVLLIFILFFAFLLSRKKKKRKKKR